MQVARPLPGIVGDVGVALEHILAGDFVHELEHGFGHGVDMAGRARDGLRQHLTVRVEDAGRQVAGLANGSRECRAQQGKRLFLDNGDQAVPHDLHADFTNVTHAWLPLRMRRMVPSCWMTASKGLVTTVEVSRSTITAGPATRSPAQSASRATMA